MSGTASPGEGRQTVPEQSVEEITRQEAEERIDELLALEVRQLSLGATG